MAKYKVKKDVFEQVTINLEKAQNRGNKGNLEEISPIFGKSINLPSSKNIFSRGDFDEYKITDEDLSERNLFSMNDEEIEKSHLYTSKYWVSGKGKRGGYWEYIYNKNNRIDNLLKIAVEKPLNIVYDKNQDNFTQSLQILSQAFDYINDWVEDWNKSENSEKSICKELRNKKICFADISYEHIAIDGHNTKNKSKLIKKGKNLREPKNLLNHVPYLPIAKKMLEEDGLWVKGRYEPLKKPKLDKAVNKMMIGIVYQSLAIELPAGMPHRFVETTVSKRKYNDNTYSDTVYISVVGKNGIKKSKSVIKKSLKMNSDFSNKSMTTNVKASSYGPGSTKHTFKHILTNFQNKSTAKPDYNGKNMLNKSFDITVENITENNKQQKFEQLEKALNAIYENKPFVIKHIPADSSHNYGSMTLKIRNFDRNKIEKAVHKMAFSLDTTVKTSKGEAFNFKAQEDLTNDIVSEITEKTKNLYSWIISYFGLPEIRVVSKADLMHKGKVVYNPETGLPIKESDWKNFVKGLENFLNRNYNGIGPKIVLNAQQLGVILDRIMARKPLNEIQKMTLDDVKQQYRSAEWISNSVKNMTDQFGESFSRDRQARLEVAIHSAGARMAGVSDEIKNKVQQTIIDGIKNKQSRAQVSQNLFDKLVGLNRDMQKIADTETQNNVNNAYLQEEVYKTAPGEKVYFKRYEIDDDNTCKYCKAVKGAIALWSDTALPDEAIDDPYAEFAIWEGKEGGSLPTGVLHPYCRGSWYRFYPEVK